LAKLILTRAIRGGKVKNYGHNGGGSSSRRVFFQKPKVVENHGLKWEESFLGDDGKHTGAGRHFRDSLKQDVPHHGQKKEQLGNKSKSKADKQCQQQPEGAVKEKRRGNDGRPSKILSRAACRQIFEKPRSAKETCKLRGLPRRKQLPKEASGDVVIKEGRRICRFHISGVKKFMSRGRGEQVG